MTGLAIQAGGLSENEIEPTGGGGITHMVRGRVDQEQTSIGVFTTKVQIVSPTGVVNIDNQPVSVVVYFDRRMKYNSALIDPSSYTITPPVDGVGVNVLSVEPENEVDPQIVTLNITEMTGFKLYKLSVLGPIGFLDHAPMDDTQAPTNLYPSFGNPIVNSVIASSKNSWVVTFSEGMLNNAAITNPDYYEFLVEKGDPSPPLQVHSVSYIAADKVLLITDDQEPGKLYTLRIHAMGPP